MWPLVTYSNYFVTVSTVTLLDSQTELISGIFFSFIDISRGGRFETTEGVTVKISALRNILATQLNDLCKYLLKQTRQFVENIFINMIATHCLILFTTELIVSAIFTSI